MKKPSLIVSKKALKQLHTGAFSLKIGIINVGVNASHGILRSPIFDDGSFEFVPIPTRCELSICLDNDGDCSKCPPHYSMFPRYEDLISPDGRDFSVYLPKEFLKLRTHNDPEFVTFTYGDFPRVPRASNLQKLRVGDQLFFLARLVRWGEDGFRDEAGFYLVGFLDIEHVYDEVELLQMVVDGDFGGDFEKIRKNGHMLFAQEYPDVWLEETSGSWVFKGSDRSRRFEHAVPFNRALADEIMRDASGNKWKWPEDETELQRIGSYTRSCRTLDDQNRIDELWRIVDSYNDRNSARGMKK